MKCPYHVDIYTIDKKAIERDRCLFIQKGIMNVDNIIRMGDGSWTKGVEIFCTGKWWVYYNRSPKYSKYKLHRRLFEMGYFVHNQVGCGKCEICKVEKSKEWATKGFCEGETWKTKCFITLTYNREGLPKDRKLKRADLQKFWKDLRYHLYKNTKKSKKVNLKNERKMMEKIPSNELEDIFGQNSRRKNRYPVRYINCGEYGPKNKRPHYHAIIFNFKPLDLRRYKRDKRGYWLYTSEKLNKIWGKGWVIIEDANQATCAYVARYTTKKYDRTPEEQEKMKKKKQIEFIGASSLGFIGYYYWLQNKEMIKRNGGILMKTNIGVHLQKIPRAMQNRWKWEDEEGFDMYTYEKNKIGEMNWKKILSGTKLSEKEYILDTYKQRIEKMRKLKRDAV